MTRPGWVDDLLFPFQSRFVGIDGCTVHYVDEGPALGLLMRPVFARTCKRLLDSLEQAALARAAGHGELPLPQPLRRLQESQARVQGPDHPDTLRMNNKLTRWLR